MFSLCHPKKKYILVSDDGETMEDDYLFSKEKEASKIKFSNILNDDLDNAHQNDITLRGVLIRNFYSIEVIFNQFEKDHPKEAETTDYLHYKRNVVDKANIILPLILNPASNQNTPDRIEKLLHDFIKTAQNHTAIWKQIGKFMCYIIAGTIIAWTIGIAIPTIIGIKLLTGSWVLSHFFHVANYMLMIPKGQSAIALCTAASFYHPVSGLLNWMCKPTPAQTVAEKIKPQLDEIKKLLQPGSSSLVAH